MKTQPLTALALALLLGSEANGEIRGVFERNEEADGAAAFHFERVPLPARGDAAEKAQFAVIAGERDPNAGTLAVLNDGRLPGGPDEPRANFFFQAGTAGGRVRVDLGRATEVKQINTYSWHAGARGPQVYTVYGSDGSGAGFQAQPAADVKPQDAGWRHLAAVDTRPGGVAAGGAHGVSISDSGGSLGSFRYLLFEISRTEDADPFGNTFYSEIDVIETGGTPEPILMASSAPPFVIETPDKGCRISIDTSKAPDLKEWAETKLAPVLAEWYPRLTNLLASLGFTPPNQFRVNIGPGQGVAATSGTLVTANADWIRSQLRGEAIGALVHEEIHVVQQYRGGRRWPEAKPPPGWLVEAIPDYIRWFRYEPQSHGADLVWMRRQQNFTPRYDASYRVSANFLNYLVETYDRDLVTKVNAVCREGRYTEDIWKELTGKPLATLGEEWKASVENQLAASSSVGS